MVQKMDHRRFLADHAKTYKIIEKTAWSTPRVEKYGGYGGGALER